MAIKVVGRLNHKTIMRRANLVSSTPLFRVPNWVTPDLQRQAAFFTSLPTKDTHAPAAQQEAFAFPSDARSKDFCSNSRTDETMLAVGMGMGLRLQQSIKQELKMKMSLEQRLELAQKLALKFKLELKQVVRLMIKLCPELKMVPGFEQKISSLLRRDRSFAFIMRDTKKSTALELQRLFPELRSLFNRVAKTQPNYDTQLRMGLILAPQLTLSQRLAITLPSVNWSPLDAWEQSKKTPCNHPKHQLAGFDEMSLAKRLQLVDLANKPFHFIYAYKGGKRKRYVKIPLMRDSNVNVDEIAIDISKEEYKLATQLLEDAGSLERIARAVPYSEIHGVILSHLEKANIDPEDAVIVGIDRGGRLPTKIVRAALGKKIAYFLKVDQGHREIDEEHLDYFIQHGTLRGKYVIFVDSTVDSGRQISALSRYFDDPDFQKDIGHTGWVVIGSNENGKTLHQHVNINWGVDPDQTFEDRPGLLGVDYAPGSLTKIVAKPSRSAREISVAFLQVPRGIILGHPIVEKALAIQKSREAAAEVPAQMPVPPAADTVVAVTPESPAPGPKPTLGIIGNGKAVDIALEEARDLALKLEGKMRFVAGTPQGNPGHLLQLLSEWGTDDITLVQPNWSTVQQPDFVGSVANSGDEKIEFRNALIASADIFLAIGGNNGTLTEFRLALDAGKHVVVNKNSGLPGTKAASMEVSGDYPNLHVVNSFAEAAARVRELVQQLQS